MLLAQMSGLFQGAGHKKGILDEKIESNVRRDEK
jgi:hypothetical protein